YGGFLRKYPK
nr:endorphin alpha,neo [Sus scrofa domesticus]